MMQTKHIFLCFCLALFVFLATINTAMAVETSGLNRLSLFIDFFVGYDSNIVEYSDDIEDSYYTIIPKIILIIPRERSYFHAGYSIRHDNYIENTEFSNTSQNVDLLGRINIGNNFSFTVKDKFVDSVYGLWRTETDSLTGQGYYINNFTPQLKYESTSAFFNCDLSFTNTVEKWDEDDHRDWTSNTVGGYFGFTLGSFTQLGVTTNFTSKDYKMIISDYDSTFFGLRLGYSIPEVIDIFAIAGTTNREYTKLNESASIFTYELVFNKIFTEITSASFSVYYNYSDSEVHLGDFFECMGGELDMYYLFREKIQLFVKSQYYSTDYEFSSREDTVIRVYSGLGYKFIDWLAVQFFYNYLDRESNFDKFDISDSRLELHLNFFHDFSF